MRQEMLLALLTKEPSQGYQLRTRLNDALGLLGEEMNDGQIYVPLSRLERAGLVAVDVAQAETVAVTGRRERWPR